MEISRDNETSNSDIEQARNIDFIQGNGDGNKEDRACGDASTKLKQE